MCTSIENEQNFSKWIYFFRQLLVCSGLWSLLFVAGLNMGTPTVLIPQLRQEANSTDAVTTEEASWLLAAISYSGIPWIIILSVLAAFIGRKITQLVVSICSLIGFVIIYCSSNIKQIMISQIFLGSGMAYGLSVAILIITEYTSTKNRGVFFPIKPATFFWGILVANTMGTFFHWKKIAWIGITCSAYSMTTVYFWPESPLWLAKQRKLDGCIENFRWLQGMNGKTKKDFEKFVHNNETTKRKPNFKFQIIDMKTAIVKNYFYKSVSLSILLSAMYMFSGKLVCTVYALDILNRITNSSSSAYIGMLILDGVTVFSMYVGCGFTKVFNRRTFLLTSATISIVLMFLIALYLYLISLLIISEDKYVSLSLLAAFSIAIGCGLLVLTPVISGELIPIHSRSFGMCLNGLAANIINGCLFKVSPYFFNYFGIHGTFLFFGITSTMLSLVAYFYLPETKDKTLQEIANNIIGVKPATKAEVSLITEGDDVN